MKTYWPVLALFALTMGFGTDMKHISFNSRGIASTDFSTSATADEMQETICNLTEQNTALKEEFEAAVADSKKIVEELEALKTKIAKQEKEEEEKLKEEKESKEELQQVITQNLAMTNPQLMLSLFGTMSAQMNVMKNALENMQTHSNEVIRTLASQMPSFDKAFQISNQSVYFLPYSGITSGDQTAMRDLNNMYNNGPRIETSPYGSLRPTQFMMIDQNQMMQL